MGSKIETMKRVALLLALFALAAIEVDAGCTIGCDKNKRPCDCPAACWECLLGKAEAAMSRVGEKKEAKLKAASMRLKAAWRDDLCMACKFKTDKSGCTSPSIQGIDCGAKNLEKLLQGQGKFAGKRVDFKTLMKNPAKYNLI